MHCWQNGRDYAKRTARFWSHVGCSIEYTSWAWVCFREEHHLLTPLPPAVFRCISSSSPEGWTTRIWVQLTWALSGFCTVYARVCMAGDVSACVCRCVCACVCVDLFERLETEFSYHLTLSRNSLSRSTDIRSSVSPPFGRKMLIGCFFCRLSNRSFALFTTRSARLTQSIERHVSEQRHAPIILRT